MDKDKCTLLIKDINGDFIQCCNNKNLNYNFCLKHMISLVREEKFNYKLSTQSDYDCLDNIRKNYTFCNGFGQHTNKKCCNLIKSTEKYCYRHKDYNNKDSDTDDDSDSDLDTDDSDSDTDYSDSDTDYNITTLPIQPVEENLIQPVEENLIQPVEDDFIQEIENVFDRFKKLKNDYKTLEQRYSELEKKYNGVRTSIVKQLKSL